VETDIREELRIIKLNSGLYASKIGLNGRKSLKWPKLSNSEVVAPEEEELKYFVCFCLDSLY
jgi:hypothetical protein